MEVTVLHAVEYLIEKVRSEQLTIHRPMNVTATYHDPCQLGRRCGVFDSPRELARSIPGLELVEMVEHHEESLCSGGGGGVAASYPELSQEIAATRVSQAEAVRAEVILTACPYCRSSLERGIEQRGATMKVIDLVEAVTYAAGLSDAK
jgi:heterodisulfide reductase subunit D